jgi:hypothetical protein
MAAMADGLPLDPAVHGEPGESPTGKEPQPAPEVAVAPTPVPTTPAPTPEVEPEKEPPKPAVVPAPEPPRPAEVAPKPVNPREALQQKLSSIDQSKPVPLKDLLALVEEMAGVPIEIDRDKLGPAAARLDQEQTLKMQNPTLEDILKKLLGQAGLDYFPGEDSIQIIRRTR